MGFWDLQVNGYGGADFLGDDLTAEALHAGCERLRHDGAEAVLATIVTDRLDRMAARPARLGRLREDDPLAASVIAGFHIEGPFLNPEDGYRGAHPAEHIRRPDAGQMRRLLDAAGGLTRVVTLAPECDAGLRLTRLLAAEGVTVAAGHCNPTLEELRAAIDAGLTMFTHLGNGCPALLPRHDNIIQRALSLADRLWLCFIGDGVHVPLPALGNYLRAAGIERSIIVSDALAPAGLGMGAYRVGRWEVEIGGDLAVRLPGTGNLVGGGAGLGHLFVNLRDRLGLGEATAYRLMTHNPRRAIGLATPPAPS